MCLLNLQIFSLTREGKVLEGCIMIFDVSLHFEDDVLLFINIFVNRLYRPSVVQTQP